MADDFAHLVEGVSDWAAPAPVTGWTARDVVGHLVEWLPGFLASGGIDLPPGPSVDDDFAAALLDGMRQMEDVLRGSGQYGPPVAVGDDAPFVDRLMGFIGRDPAWTPITQDRRRTAGPRPAATR